MAVRKLFSNAHAPAANAKWVFIAVGGLLLVVGVILATVFISIGVHNNHIRQDGIATVASPVRVISHVLEQRNGNTQPATVTHRTYWIAVFSYEVAGKQYTLHSGDFNSRASASELLTKPLKVQYLADDPSQALLLQ